MNTHNVNGKTKRVFGYLFFVGQPPPPLYKWRDFSMGVSDIARERGGEIWEMLIKFRKFLFLNFQEMI